MERRNKRLFDKLESIKGFEEDNDDDKDSSNKKESSYLDQPNIPESLEYRMNVNECSPSKYIKLLNFNMFFI